MGYELDRIISQYGMSPSVALPGVAPVVPAAVAPTSEQQAADYNALIAKYNVEMPAYLAAKAQAEQSKAQNAAALKAGNMYAQPQFGYTGGPAAIPTVATVAPQEFTPLAPLAYLKPTVTPAASGAVSSGSDGGGGYTDTTGPGPAGVTTTGGYGTLGALGNAAQIGLGMIANAISPPGAPNPNVDVVDLGQATYGNVGSVAAPGYGVGSMAGINSMDAMSDAYGQNSGTTAAMSGGFSDSGGGYESAPGQDSGSSGAFGGGFGDSGFSDSGGGESGGSDSDGGSDGGDYARGGIVRRRFAGGGLNDLAGKYEVGSDEMPMPAVEAEPEISAPAMEAPASPFSAMPAGLAQMLAKYQGGDSAYGAELKTAREADTRESDAFAKMLQGAIDQSGQAAPSKAEMYFRLAAAFGAPTRTGSFTESLAAAGKTMGEYAKETRDAERASKSAKLQLALEAQKMRMAGAKENLSTLRTLAGEEMKDKRAVATKLLEQYIASGKPQSEAGKVAMDSNLKPGTPEFSEFVKNYVDRKIESGDMYKQAMLALSQSNAALQQDKFGFQREQAQKLTAPEMKLKTETEDILAQTSQAYGNLKKALDLNPNTFDTSLVDTAQRKALEAVGSKDQKVINTRELENMLEKASLSQLKSTFPGAISNDERKALEATQGLQAKSVEERAKIMKNAADALKSAYTRNKKRLNEINTGAYRGTQMPGEAE